MTSVLYLDTETFSPVPIKNGTYRYAEEVEVMLVLYAFDDGEPICWDRTKDFMPPDLYNALVDPSVIVVIHNSQFDRAVMAANDFPEVPDDRLFDTMACALSHSLPGSLEKLCPILGIPDDLAKNKSGKALIQFFCVPKRGGGRNTRETHPEKWAEFIDYGLSDITSMREAYKRLPKWNYPSHEADMFHLDQTINRRGFQVDVELAETAIAAIDKAQVKLAAEAQELTGGVVMSTTQRNAVLEYINETYGLELPDLRASTVESALAKADLPNSLTVLLLNRLQSTTSSTAKYKALRKSVNADGRLRGTLQYCGALRTGRWGGRLFQPQNLPRPVLKNDTIDQGIAAFKAGCIALLFPNVMEVASSAIRGCIVAPPGKKLVVADLSNIEGRVLAWLAGETWKLKAFADYDAGTGHDLYKLAYAKSFAVKPESVDKEQRQVGKVQELALGYEGGVGAFLTFAAAYGIDLDDMASKVEGIPADVQAQCNKFYAWAEIQGKTLGLSEQTFKACDALKRLWRRAHPAVEQLWRKLEDTVKEAVYNPGRLYNITAATGEIRLRVRRDGAWLRVGLPSGRCLCYPVPEIKGGCCDVCRGSGRLLVGGFIEDGDVAHNEDCPECNGTGDLGKPKLTYMGVNQYSRKWSRLHTYGGKLVENVTQAVARDVLAFGMQAAEEAGYEVVLSVHDELLTETPDTPDYDHESLSALMSTNPAWAEGLPLAAAGFEAHRYRKD